ncbi:hypothetical protein MUN82_06400 [Hymenobacter aerilatus]|uniref:Uncharacterized protein n=1 Tax=Hymenobacter aerilatus TaxID=2932251 RepID=A0A8T9SXY3_9BACT|nr:hypothetical protein [Hymenobacter aerilatus]UOR06725.1 hypothetical protein MUN82_06400 [Hymenobacter aerilatus]
MMLREGDIIRTSYGTGPYRIRELTTVGGRLSLVCEDLRPDVGRVTAYLNDYEPLPDGTWQRAGSTDQLFFIERPAPRPGTQFDLFA